MASQQYSLRWNNYVRHMTSAFESLRSDRDLIDVTLSCEGKKIPAHKMLLSACSSYFKDLFKENPCQHPVIIFRNVTFDDLMALVDFMYNGEVNVEQEQLASFLHTAELLQVQGLTNSNKDSETKTKKTAKQQDERVPAPEVQFDEDGHPSPYQSDERTSTPTRTTGPPAAKKRKWQSPSRTASPAEVQAIPQGASSGGEGEEGEPHQMEDVPLKTEAAEYEDDDDEQASGADDIVEEQESIIAKIQKSDQLILTTSTSRSRASNSDHSLFGGNVMDMLSTSESGDMGNFVMAGPSNESMGQEGIQEIKLDGSDDEWNSIDELDPLDVTIDFIDSVYSEEKAEPKSTPKLITKAQRRSNQKPAVSHEAVKERPIRSRKVPLKLTAAESAVQQISKKYKARNRKEEKTRVMSYKGRNVGDYQCHICEYRFQTPNSLYAHRHMHKGETTCPKCRKFFSRKDSMLIHLYARHYADHSLFTEMKKHSTCWLCPALRNHKNPDIKLHISRKHLDFSRCPLCSRKFTKKREMLNHLYHEHHQPNMD
ncbi:protein tramtrack, alpha isoform-like isoform X1 [Neocloeon triangulifer]|uniref:protein tramtrack, alpha isoform-like isoform X1 n=1 Tax=Neocloeon triangulifer TaxID=2078957 RepID=UPI00286ED972|nr:protein tramtrack, alpha isoform-like isoform X1 [Neocloeon triangulifer]